MDKPITDFRKQEILADMRKYMFGNETIGITDFENITRYGEVFNVSQVSGVTVLMEEIGQKYTFDLADIQYYEVV